MRAAILLVATLTAATACTESPIQPVDQGPLFAKVAVAGPAQVTGEIGPGAAYELFLPADWNGDLVLYAHGYTNPAAPIALPRSEPGKIDVDALRVRLLALGYGVAWSSWSENGYAVKDGVIRTRQLRGLFASNFGSPKSTFLMGHSLGGIVTLMAAEKNPGLYAGALPMCSLVGGGPMEVDYIYDVRVLFDYFFPGVIPGNALEIPEGLDFGLDVVLSVIGAVSSNPSAALELAGMDQIQLPFTSFPELISSILNPLFFNIVGTEDFLDRTHQTFFENSTKMYTGSSDDDALNAGVDRFEGSKAARNYLEHWYLPTGNLKIPVLTLHTTMDPVVPFLHESIYEGIVSSAGKSNFLVQRAVDAYGHCNFTVQEQIDAFQDLVNWVDNQVSPTP